MWCTSTQPASARRPETRWRFHLSRCPGFGVHFCHRWLATALLDIEPRLRKVMGYRHLPTLRAALKRELKIDTTTSKKQAA